MRRAGRRRGGEVLRRVVRHLDLAGAQRDQLRALFEARRESVAAWREANPNATADERRAFGRAQAEAFEQAFVALLTPHGRAAGES